MWRTFLTDRRVPLTNNLAERALRPYVIWRKVVDAGQSRRGNRFRAMALSVTMTGRQLGVPIYAYLRRICEESLSSRGVTTLLPLGVLRLPACPLPAPPGLHGWRCAVNFYFSAYPVLVNCRSRGARLFLFELRIRIETLRYPLYT